VEPARKSPSAALRPVLKRQGRGGIPQLLDIYLLRSFLYYFLLLTVGFICSSRYSRFSSSWTTLRSIVPGCSKCSSYFIYLASYLFYQLAPLAALVAALVTLGIMTKNNELVAFKAGGISLYRISVPLLMAGLMLGGALVVLDDTYLPYANQRQDALRNQIKGRPRKPTTSLAAVDLANTRKFTITNSSTRISSFSAT